MPLTYPVDLDARYTIYDPVTGGVFKNDSGSPQNKRGWPVDDGSAFTSTHQWLLNVTATPPVEGVDYDSATEVVEFQVPVYDLIAETATYRNWTKRAKTQGEVDAPRDESRAGALAAIDATALEGSEEGVRLRAAVISLNRRVNWLTNRLEEVLSTLEDVRVGSGSAQSIRDAVPPQHGLQATQNPLTTPSGFSLIDVRPKSEAMQDYRDDINDGSADTSV